MMDVDPTVTVQASDGAEATVSLQGGQVLAWRTASGTEPLYRSATAPLPGRAVRGGVPICFPQFGSRGSLPKHGFARNVTWSKGTMTDGHAELVLRSKGTDEWPHAFELALHVSVHGEVLDLALQASNSGSDSWDFTGALHTYLAVVDVHRAVLRGLQGCTYEDALQACRRVTQSVPAPAFGEEFDRIYLSPPSSLELDPVSGTLVRITQEGFADTVVWNPGAAKAASLGDMPPEDWTRMLCVEAAVVERPVTLVPGASWTGRQRLECVPAAT